MGYFIGSKCKWCRKNTVRFGSPFCSKKCESESKGSKSGSNSDSSDESTGNSALFGFIFGLGLVGVFLYWLYIQVVSLLFYWTAIYLVDQTTIYKDIEFKDKRSYNIKVEDYQDFNISIKNKKTGEEKDLDIALSINKVDSEEIIYKGIENKVISYKIAPRYNDEFQYVKPEDIALKKSKELEIMIMKEAKKKFKKESNEFKDWEILKVNF